MHAIYNKIGICKFAWIIQVKKKKTREYSEALSSSAMSRNVEGGMIPSTGATILVVFNFLKEHHGLLSLQVEGG